nr:hypothetical protein [Tanacetum cinerariifolium]
MIVIQNTVISDDVAEQFFVCNLGACKGACCVEGDLGAPLELEELDILKQEYPKIEPFLTEAGKAAIAEQGLEALNYDRWDICSPACSFGAKLGVPVYKFLQEPLERKYGAACADLMPKCGARAQGTTAGQTTVETGGGRNYLRETGLEAVRHHAAPASWLSSYFLFSFADYFDKSNMHFGPLRVFNDDTVAPQNGFPQHPHSEMEIVTLVLEGEVSHEDTLGNRTTITAGEVQRMTSGTGLAHSEMNRQDSQLHLYQLWFMPSQKGLAPSYEQKDLGFLSSKKNELIPLVTGQKVLEDV